MTATTKCYWDLSGDPVFWGTTYWFIHGLIFSYPVFTSLRLFPVFARRPFALLPFGKKVWLQKKKKMIGPIPKVSGLR